MKIFKSEKDTEALRAYWLGVATTMYTMQMVMQLPDDVVNSIPPLLKESIRTTKPEYFPSEQSFEDDLKAKEGESKFGKDMSAILQRTLEIFQEQVSEYLKEHGMPEPEEGDERPVEVTLKGGSIEELRKINPDLADALEPFVGKGEEGDKGSEKGDGGFLGTKH
jgi:hypothetical protein